MKIVNRLLISILFSFGGLNAYGSMFQSHIEAVPDDLCAKMSSLKVMTPANPVQCDRLRRVVFSYFDFSGTVHSNGEIMVLDAAAPAVESIFRELFLLRFPIAKARLINHYSGDDQKSLADNNSSSFNSRPVTGKSVLSIHAYGLAIDINPVQNPFVTFPNKSPGFARYYPAAGAAFANRNNTRRGKPFRAGMSEDVVDIFTRHGFAIWGGGWDNPIDYQHFQVSREVAEFLAATPAKLATRFFSNHTKFIQQFFETCPEQASDRRLQDYSQWLKQKLGSSPKEKLLTVYRQQTRAMSTLINDFTLQASRGISCPAPVDKPA
ncbi:M15 family metallopeptidase [Endozoicomonadaceae bacterium StTr2]